MKPPKWKRIARAIAGCEGSLEDCLKRAHQAQRTKVKLLEMFHIEKSQPNIIRGLSKCDFYVGFYLKKSIRYQKAKTKLYEMADREGILIPTIKAKPHELH